MRRTIRLATLVLVATAVLGACDPEDESPDDDVSEVDVSEEASEPAAADTPSATTSPSEAPSPSDTAPNVLVGAEAGLEAVFVEPLPEDHAYRPLPKPALDELVNEALASRSADRAFEAVDARLVMSNGREVAVVIAARLAEVVPPEAHDVIAKEAAGDGEYEEVEIGGVTAFAITTSDATMLIALNGDLMVQIVGPERGVIDPIGEVIFPAF